MAAAHHLHATPAERNDELIGSRMIAHRLPVVSAFGARTRLNPFADLLLEDVAAIRWLSCLRIDAREDVLEDRFLKPEELVSLAVELPQDPGFADGKHQLLAAAVDQHALEDFIEIERFAWHMLEVPGELAVVRIERDRRAGEQRLVSRFGPAADAHPRLGLRDAPVCFVGIGIITAGDPRFAAGAHQVWKRAPRIAPGLISARDGVKFPKLFAGRRIIGADEAALAAGTARIPSDPAPPLPLMTSGPLVLL